MKTRCENVNEPDIWCTIIPLVDLYAGLKTPVCFAGGFLLTPVPDLLRQDEWIEGLSAADRKVLEGLLYAFVVEYETPPDVTSGSPADDSISIKVQRVKLEIAQLANFALWLARPSPACFDLVFNSPRREGGWRLPFIEKKSRIICHSRDRGGLLSDADLDEARRLHSALCAMPEDSAVRTAVHAGWSALQLDQVEVRYLLLWIGLEALFASEDGGRSADLLAGRIGRFISNDNRSAEERYQRARPAYLLKSRIAYGQTTEPAALAEFAHETEALLRHAIRKILSVRELTERFSRGADREDFLKGLTAEA
jgi:hypothetical protein